MEPSPTAKARDVVADLTDMVETVREPAGLTGKDKAVQLLEAVNHNIVVTPQDDIRLSRRTDAAILPIILVIYCLQSLDKTALAYASVFGLIEDANLHGEEFLIFQPLVAYLLVKLPIGKFCGAMVLCWGATLCGMSAGRSFGGLMAARFILGSFEASVAPSLIAIVQMWYRRSEQTNRNAAWYSIYGLAHIHSEALHPYQLIFLFCGCLTVAFSLVVFVWLPDSPMQARFLGDDDKLLVIERLRMNQQGISSGVWRWDHVAECLVDVKTWLWFTLLTAISIPSGGISTFGPLIVQSFGFDSFTTILFNMPFGAVQMIATVGSAVAATHWKRKSPILAALCIPSIIGISILLSVEYNESNQAVLLFAYYITSVYPAISPLIYSWSGQNTAGDTKRKVTTGILFIGASAGNILGPHLYTPAEAPRYTRGLISNLALFVVIIVLAGFGAVWIKVLNRRHAITRERMGKSADVIDLSMEDRNVLAVHGDAINDRQAAGGVGDKAFDDCTDLMNEDFIFLM
nr:putative transporter [Quercus suber]